MVTRYIVVLSLILASSHSIWSQLRIVDVVNPATYKSGMPAGGGLASILCTGLKGDPGTFVPSSLLPVPFTLAGVAVAVNGAAAPILAVYIPPDGESAYSQINIQVPVERNSTLQPNLRDVGGMLSVVVLERGEVARLTPLPSAGEAAGFFSDADGYAIARHASDDSLISPDNPARPGETIIAYANDFFRTWPPSPIGFPVPSEPLFKYAVPIGYGNNLYLQEYPGVIEPGPGVAGGSFTNTPALKITFEGLAVGQVGVEQINLVVPANQQPGGWALFFNVGSCPDGSGQCSFSGVSSAYVKLPVR